MFLMYPHHTVRFGRPTHASLFLSTATLLAGNPTPAAKVNEENVAPQSKVSSPSPKPAVRLDSKFSPEAPAPPDSPQINDVDSVDSPKGLNRRDLPVVESPKGLNRRDLAVIESPKGLNKRVLDDVAPPGPNPFDELRQDRSLLRKVILHMALQRNVGDDQVPRDESPGKITLGRIDYCTNKTVIEDGFYWREFPVCEQVLYKNMADYYGISSVSRSARMQQDFNKKLVEEVRLAALDSGLTFDPSFTEKKLRDRIRCFYKTHLQNAKKRLVTLQKRTDSANNQAILRVYIRCVKTGMSFPDSLNMEPTMPPSKRGRLSHVEKAKQNLDLEALQQEAV